VGPPQREAPGGTIRVGLAGEQRIGLAEEALNGGLERRAPVFTSLDVRQRVLLVAHLTRLVDEHDPGPHPRRRRDRHIIRLKPGHGAATVTIDRGESDASAAHAHDFRYLPELITG